MVGAALRGPAPPFLIPEWMGGGGLLAQQDAF